MANWAFVANQGEIPEGDRKITEVGGLTIAVFNLSTGIYAIEDKCTHQFLPLADGFLDGEDIICPFHGAKFSLKTGEVLAPPACDPLTTFPTKVEDGKIYIQIG